MTQAPAFAGKIATVGSARQLPMRRGYTPNIENTKMGGCDFASKKQIIGLHLKDVDFEGPVNIQHTNIKQLDFDDVNFGSRHSANNPSFHATKFETRPSFRFKGFTPYLAFSGAQFEEGVLLWEKSGNELKLAKFLFNDAATNAGWKRAEYGSEYFRKRSEKRVGDSLSKSQLDRYLERSEDGIRNLRCVLLKNEEQKRAQIYHALEKRMHNRRPTTGITEKIISCIYWITSGYGLNILKPVLLYVILSLLLAFCCVAGLFPYKEIDVGDPSSTVSILEVWARAMFRPFDIWRSSLPEKIIDGGAAVLWFKLVWSFASLLFVGALFLSLLAVRRLFQIT